MDRIGNINIIQVVDVAGNGNMVRIGKYYWKWKYCRNRKYYRKRKYCQNQKYYRNREFNQKRIVRISIGRGLLDEGPARSQARAQQAERPTWSCHSLVRPSARPGPARPWRAHAKRVVGLRAATARVGRKACAGGAMLVAIRCSCS